MDIEELAKSAAFAFSQMVDALSEGDMFRAGRHFEEAQRYTRELEKKTARPTAADMMQHITETTLGF